jgi:hypothetical protein
MDFSPEKIYRAILPLVAMKWCYGLAALLLLVALSVPVQAFTADRLDISVRENGDANITFDYTLNWLEYLAVFLHVADPAVELQKALQSNTYATVTVNSVSPRVVSLDVQKFAVVQDEANGTTLTTPAVSFAEAERVLQQYWFSNMISPDFSPAITVIHFPDGYSQTFYDQITIPSVSHTTGQ